MVSGGWVRGGGKWYARRSLCGMGLIGRVAAGASGRLHEFEVRGSDASHARDPPAKMLAGRWTGWVGFRGLEMGLERLCRSLKIVLRTSGKPC